MLCSKNRVLVCDSEAVGLLDQIRENHIEDMHIIVAKDVHTNEIFKFYDKFEKRINAVWLDELEEQMDGTLEEGIIFLNECACLIMQNSTGFDYLAFEKVAPELWTRDIFRKVDDLGLVSPMNEPDLSGYQELFKDMLESEMTTMEEVYPYHDMDTVVMSRTLNPDRKLPQLAYTQGRGNIGAHTIEAHGYRMGRFKPDHEDWTHLSADMVHRCSEDVVIGTDFYFFLLEEMFDQRKRASKTSGMNIDDAYHSEMRVATSMAHQARRGFRVDIPFMENLYQELTEKIDATEKAFRPHMPKRIKMKKVSSDDCDKRKPLLVELIMTTQGCEKMEAMKQASAWENEMWEADFRHGYAAPQYKLTTAKGLYSKAVAKYIPTAIGKPSDYEKLPVGGAFTPLVMEDIPLGNREEVKKILYSKGWLGVVFNDTELDYIEEIGEIPKPWSGKIEEKSIKAWKERDGSIPEWCEGIAEWYVMTSRRNVILNKKDMDYFKLNGNFPTYKGIPNHCRGLLPIARIYDGTGKWAGISQKEYYEVHGKFCSASGNWRVPAIAFHTATNTFRMRHKVVVNIPSRGLYGHEMRRMFIADEGKMILGCDGAGLELRMLSHFMGDPEYIDVVLNGDIHTHNQNKAGLPMRDTAKTFIYAFLYGSGIANLARVANMTESEMEECVERFKRELPHLDKLIQRVQGAGEHFGYLLSFDGRRGRIRSKGGKISIHTALNVLLQMAGSLIMKYSHIFAEDAALEQGLIEKLSDFPIVAHQHDEGQMEIDACDVEEYIYHLKSDEWDVEEKFEYIDPQGRMWSAPKIIDTIGDELTIRRRYHPIGETYALAIKKAGEFFNLRIPTAGEYLIGDSWADTH